MERSGDGRKITIQDGYTVKRIVTRSIKFVKKICTALLAIVTNMRLMTPS